MAADTATSGEAEARVQKAMKDIDQHYWQADFESTLRPIASQLAASGGYGDLKDPARLEVLRQPGPMPPQADGLNFTERTIPNLAGDHEIPVRIYVPSKPNALRPAYVLFHGGGLSMGHLNTEHPRCVELTRSCGAVGISVDFRMAPENPPNVILDDCYSALRWTVDNAADLGIDPRRVAITGGSGGGMMTFSIAQMARDRGDVKPLAQLVMYPDTDDREPDHFVSRHTPFAIINNKGVNMVMQNLAAHGPYPPYIIPNRTDDLRGLCPATVIVAGNDTLRDEAIEYATRLIRAGVPTGLHVIPGVAHGFDLLAPNSSATKQAYDLMHEAFLRTAAEVK